MNGSEITNTLMGVVCAIDVGIFIWFMVWHALSGNDAGTESVPSWFFPMIGVGAIAIYLFSLGILVNIYLPFTRGVYVPLVFIMMLWYQIFVMREHFTKAVQVSS